MDEQKHHQKNATHAPAETSSEHENEQFYNGLNESVASIYTKAKLCYNSWIKILVSVQHLTKLLHQ